MGFLFLTLYSWAALADWAPMSNAVYSLEKDDINIDVADDGTYTMIDERTFKALNENGRAKLVLESIPYEPEISSVEVISAVSITNNVETKVNPKSVQTRKAQGNAHGLDSRMELIIPFTNMQVGSSIRYKLSYKIKKPDFPGLFSMRFVQGLQFPEMGGRIVIKSSKKLHSAALDKDKIFSMTSSMEGPKFVLIIDQIKPAFRIPMDFSPSIIKGSLSQFDVSTGESWKSLIEDLSAKYEKIFAVADLPPALKTIADKAAGGKDIHAKIDIVTSELAAIMTYSGDWTSSDKFFVAQPLSTIALKKTGDCKDFATATAAILRKLGMEADVAIVRRSGGSGLAMAEILKPIDDSIVLPELFNHAIVHVKNQEQSIWVDPTNIVSNSRLIFEDIAKSPALVLSKSSASLQFLPDVRPEDNKAILTKTMKINADNTVDSEGSLSLTGEYAKDIAELALTKSEKDAETVLMALYGTDAKSTQHFLEGVNFKNRIPTSLDAKIKTLSEKVAGEKDGKTYLGVVISSRLSPYFKAGTKRVSDLYIGTAAIEESTVNVEGYDFGDKTLGCSVQTPWYSAERKFLKTPHGFQIADRVRIKKSIISATEINKERFSYELGNIENCADAQKIEVIKLDPSKTLAQRLEKYTVAEVKRLANASGPESVHKAAMAKHMAEQLLVNDPKNKELRIHYYESLIMIGYIRNDIDRTEYLDEAAKVADQLYLEFPNDPDVLQKKTHLAIKRKNPEQIKKFFALAYYASPKNSQLYTLGGRVADGLNQFSTAEGSYKKALTLTKDSEEQGQIYSYLADLMCHSKQCKRGIEFYAKAVERLPNDAWLFSRYVGLLNSQKMWDESIAAAEKMLKISDFGVGRRLLAEAYSGKALSIWSARLRQGGMMGDPEQDAIAVICMKALKYKENDSGCLRLIGFFALNTAKVESKIDQAQKAYDYFDRALKDEDLEDQSGVLTLKAQAQKEIDRIKNQAGRSPSSGN